ETGTIGIAGDVDRAIADVNGIAAQSAIGDSAPCANACADPGTNTSSNSRNANSPAAARMRTAGDLSPSADPRPDGAIDPATHPRTKSRARLGAGPPTNPDPGMRPSAGIQVGTGINPGPSIRSSAGVDARSLTRGDPRRCSRTWRVVRMT